MSKNGIRIHFKDHSYQRQNNRHDLIVTTSHSVVNAYAFIRALDGAAQRSVPVSSEEQRPNVARSNRDCLAHHQGHASHHTAIPPQPFEPSWREEAHRSVHVSS